MQDLRALMPHSKPECKMERKDDLFVVNEVSFKFICLYICMCMYDKCI